MPLEIKPIDRIKFREDLRYENLPGGFQVSTKFKTFRFRNDVYAKNLGELVRCGSKTAEEIIDALNIQGVPRKEVFKSLNLLFKSGLLNDELTLS